MLLCDGRRCSRSVPIAFRNRKNTMYHEQDYFCDSLLQLCSSEIFKDVWSLACLGMQNKASRLYLLLPMQSRLVSQLLVPKVFCSWSHQGGPHKTEMKVAWDILLKGHSQHLVLFFQVCNADCSLWKAAGIARGWFVSGGMNCLWACAPVLGEDEVPMTRYLSCV